MTASPAALAGLVQQRQMDEAAAYEDQVAAEAVGDADDRMAELLAAVAALWAGAFGSTTAAGAGKDLAKLLRTVTERLERALAGLGDRARRALLKALPGAVSLGAGHARAFLRAAGHRVPRDAGAGVRVGAAALREAGRMEEIVREQLDRALRLLAAGGDRFPALAAALQVARSAVSRVRGAVAWLVHGAVSRGSDAVTELLGLSRVWVAELDACVRCAAYSGEVAGPGEPFDGGRSFDPQQSGPAVDTVDGPPLHPHCRCRPVPWSPSWRHDGPSLPELLQQQAAEAIAEGWALPSESGAARIRAARALLASGRRLPPRVAAKARRAISSGRFPRRTTPRS